MKKLVNILALLILPFFIIVLEKTLLKPILSFLTLPEPALYLLQVSICSAFLVSFGAITGNSYGLKIAKKNQQLIGSMLLILVASSLLWLSSLQVKGFLDSLGVVYLFNLLFTVFREEFMLRGIVQTKAKDFLKGKWLYVPGPIWLSSISFSVLHLINLLYFPWQTVELQMTATLPAGIVLGFIKEKTESTLLTYLLHICGDLLFLSFYSLLFGALFMPLF